MRQCGDESRERLLAALAVTMRHWVATDDPTVRAVLDDVMAALEGTS